MHSAVLPVFLFALCVLGLALGLLLVANVFNPRRRGRVKEMPYESGMDPIHDTRRPFTIRFYLVAIAFLVFDVEVLFIYPWAVAARPAVVEQDVAHQAAVTRERAKAGPSSTMPHTELTASEWRGLDAAVLGPARTVESRHLIFAGVMAFTAMLILGFVYDWRKGVFLWQ